MRLQEYKNHLCRLDVGAEAFDSTMSAIMDFVDFLTDLGVEISCAGKTEVERHARMLVEEGRNSLERFSCLRDYADWLGYRDLYVAFVEVMDCHNALDVLADEIETRHGRETRDRIFREGLPALGAGEEERCAYTRGILGQMASHLTCDETRDAWFQVQHGIPVEVWHQSDEAEKEVFRECGDIDAYLDRKRQQRDALLTRLRNEGMLWYTVEITDDVLDLVMGDPEMEVGRRDGDRIYISKIPYNAVHYLRESDPKMKRYYACHCPLLRDAILKDLPVSPEVCNCSLGHASHYLAGLDMDLRGEVLESAVKGDSRCRFVFYLPDVEGD